MFVTNRRDSLLGSSIHFNCRLREVLDGADRSVLGIIRRNRFDIGLGRRFTLLHGCLFVRLGCHFLRFVHLRRLLDGELWSLRRPLDADEGAAQQLGEVEENGGDQHDSLASQTVGEEGDD